LFDEVNIQPLFRYKQVIINFNITLTFVNVL